MEDLNGPNILSGLPEKIRNLISNIVTGLLIAMLLLIMFAGYRSITSRYAGTTESSYLMGTFFEIKVNGTNSAPQIRSALEKIRELSNALNYFDSKSELSQVNAMSGISAFAVSHDTYDVIDKAYQFSRRSGGAFDLTIGPLMDLWNITATDHSKIPSGNELAYAQHLVNYGNIVLSEQSETVKLMYPGMKIDLGGIAKGYAISKARAILVDKGVKSAIISAGSSIAVIGDNKGKPWKVAIKDPRHPDENVGVLSLKAGQAVSTSGDYENYFMFDGKRYHHMIDPLTGMPAEGTRSVTIVCNDATLADMLSTAVFVMGPSRGMSFASTFPDTYAVIIDKDGLVLTSQGMTLER